MRRLFPKGLTSTLVVFLMFMIITLPYQNTVYAQDTAAVACADGQKAAEKVINPRMWLAIGCLTGLVGWLIAYVVEPTPPVASLLGKSEEYVAVYTDCYKEKGRNIQSKNALTGCAIAGGVYLVYYLVVIAIIADDINDINNL